MHPKPLVGNIHGANRRNVGVIGLLRTPCRGQHPETRLLHQVNDVQESEYFVDPAILHLAKFAPADMDILAGGRETLVGNRGIFVA